MNKILYICHRIPYPPNKGDKIRSFNEIKHLSHLNTVDLISFADDPEDMKYGTDLKKYCRKVKIFSLNRTAGKIKGFFSLASGQCISQGYFYQKRAQGVVDKWIDMEKYNAIICFSSPMAEYVFRAENRGKELPVNLIMDFCDLDSDKWKQYADLSGFPMNVIYRFEAARLLDFEVRINKRFTRSVFISTKEADLFLQYYPGAKNVDIIPNGVDHGYFDPEKTKVLQEFSDPVIAFYGAMDYYANVEGVLWFGEKILPLIQMQIPDISFYVVGSNPDPRLKILEKNPAVIITGFVDDIREYYKAAQVCVIPLRIARGVQNKVLEAMSMSRAVVTTSPAVQGIISGEDLPLMITDDPKDFARTVIDLLKDDGKRKFLGRAARDYIFSHFNWEKNIRLFDQAETNGKV